MFKLKNMKILKTWQLDHKSPGGHWQSSMTNPRVAVEAMVSHGVTWREHISCLEDISIKTSIYRGFQIAMFEYWVMINV